MPRTYENPPIIEALCEIQFPQGTPWDMTMPGYIHNKLEKDFPNKRELQGFNLAWEAKEESVEQSVRVSDRLIFASEDEKTLVQIGKGIVAVHRLKPYKSWEHFCPLIKQGMNAYFEVVKPERIKSASLRFINQIKFDTNIVEVKDYFNFYPFIGRSLPQDYYSFITGIRVPYESGRDALKIVINAKESKEKELLLLKLDLEYFLRVPEELKIESVFDWVNEAHNRVESSFEGCITDKLREMFGQQVESQ